MTFLRENNPDFMFKRTAEQALKDWAAQPNRKPLILRGARQVGKTTLVNLFATQFKYYIRLNLDRVQDSQLFEKDDAHTFIDALFFKHNLSKAVACETLLFIDEIQNNPKAVEALRYLYEDYPQLAVIAAGSLLESLIDVHVSFPVGRVTFLHLYPLTFIEYLNALQETEAAAMLANTVIPSYAHETLMQHFYRYALIGGMPEIVSRYASTRDITVLQPLYQDLLLAYDNDVEKYAKNVGSARAVIRHCIHRAPFEIAKRIHFQGFGSSNYGSKEVKSALLLLEKAMVLTLIYPTTTPTVPILPNFTRSPRVQFLDTGLVNAAVGLQSDFFELKKLDEIYQGRIAEHWVAQALIAKGYQPDQNLAFWVREKKQSSAELDFVIQWNNQLIPIEVKSGASGTLKSLLGFLDESEQQVAIRIHAKPFSIEQHRTPKGKIFTLINIPFYAIHHLEHYLAEHA